MSLATIKPADEVGKITTFIQDTFKKASKDTAVVAVSGGIDSATSLALTTKALSPDQIHVLLLPSMQSSSKNTDDARLLAESLGISTEQILEINLAAAQEAVAKTLELYQVQRSDKNLETRIGNIAARLRMIFVFDQAKALNALVVGTENKSEHVLAYYTRFGDEASDLEVIKHLYKTQVYTLAEYLEIPEVFLQKPPSAGLWAEQTDENELGFTYLQADPILYEYYDNSLTEAEIIDQGHDPILVKTVLGKVKSSHFKHQVPYSL